MSDDEDDVGVGYAAGDRADVRGGTTFVESPAGGRVFRSEMHSLSDFLELPLRKVLEARDEGRLGELIAEHERVSAGSAARRRAVARGRAERRLAGATGGSTSAAEAYMLGMRQGPAARAGIGRSVARALDYLETRRQP